MCRIWWGDLEAGSDLMARRINYCFSRESIPDRAAPNYCVIPTRITVLMKLQWNQVVICVPNIWFLIAQERRDGGKISRKVLTIEKGMVGFAKTTELRSLGITPSLLVLEVQDVPWGWFVKNRIMSELTIYLCNLGVCLYKVSCKCEYYARKMRWEDVVSGGCKY
jgi:hypothetical protein